MIAIRVKVKPGSFNDELILEETGSLLIKIKERPVDGAANRQLIKFLSSIFDVPKSSVILEKGSNSRFKKLSLAIDQTKFDKIIHLYKKKVF